MLCHSLWDFDKVLKITQNYCPSNENIKTAFVLYAQLSVAKFTEVNYCFKKMPQLSLLKLTNLVNHGIKTNISSDSAFICCSWLQRSSA